MDHITIAMEMVDHMSTPAFCVKDGIIVKVNPAATARMIESGAELSGLLLTGREEYSEFTGGCLYLTLSVCGQALGTSVTRKQDFDLFVLEQESDQSELRAMALAARELREPLNSIMISADRLFPATDSDNDQIREQVARMNRGLFQMIRLINNMSHASLFTSDTCFRQEICDVTGFIREIVTKSVSLLENSRIHITSDLYPEAVYSLASTEKLERAIYNIISNAIKFTPEEGTLHISLTRRKNKLYFSVLDSGCGISENLRSSVFSRYTREPGLEDSRHGIGLGMVIVRATAASHGGTVLVDHPNQQGTRVTMTLPIRPGTAKELRSPVMRVDYAGGRDHALLDLSECLSADSYDPKIIN